MIRLKLCTQHDVCNITHAIKKKCKKCIEFQTQLYTESIQGEICIYSVLDKLRDVPYQFHKKHGADQTKHKKALVLCVCVCVCMYVHECVRARVHLHARACPQTLNSTTSLSRSSASVTLVLLSGVLTALETKAANHRELTPKSITTAEPEVPCVPVLLAVRRRSGRPRGPTHSHSSVPGLLLFVGRKEGRAGGRVGCVTRESVRRSNQDRRFSGRASEQ